MCHCLCSVCSLHEFLFFSCRVPGDIRASLQPGTFLTHKPRSKELKLEPESPLPTPSPESPSRSSCQPNSPAESKTCNLGEPKNSPDPKACNWKKYKYIVLNPFCAITTVKEEEPEEVQQQLRHTPTSDRMEVTLKPTIEEWPGEGSGQNDRCVVNILQYWYFKTNKSY